MGYVNKPLKSPASQQQQQQQHSSSIPNGNGSGNGMMYPPTKDMFETLMTPSNFGPFEIITLLFIIYQMSTILFISYLPTLFYLISFIFWRLSYNLLLGIILYHQHKYKTLTNIQIPPQARTLFSWAISRPIRKQSWDWSDTPLTFNIWLIFRSLAMIILANDGISFVITCIACFKPFQQSSYFTLFITLPLVLPVIYAGYWIKKKAHDALGDYGWFWGDFFFVKKMVWVEDGVFTICPHPMYTLGYLPYYAGCLLCRSYSLLFVSLLAHTWQMLFLYLVEEPHTTATYSNNNVSSASDSASSQQQTKMKIIDDDSNIPDNPALRLFEQATPHAIVYISLIFSCMTLTLILSFISPSRKSIIILFMLTILFRFLYFLFLSVFLSKPINGDNEWVTLLRSTGTSHSRIFSAWQHTLLISTCLNHTLFIITTIITSSFKLSMLFTIRYLSLCFLGIILMHISYAVNNATYSIIGNFGQFYGDFFVTTTKNHYKSKVGSFKYLNHPSTVCMYLSYHGIILIAQANPIIHLLAIVCQVLHIMFVIGIEIPHLENEFGNTCRNRKYSPSVAAVLDALPFLTPLWEKLQISLRHSWLMVVSLFDGCVNSIRIEKFITDFSKLKSKIIGIFEGHVADVVQKGYDRIKHISCGDIIMRLRQLGMVIHDVGPAAPEVQ